MNQQNNMSLVGKLLKSIKSNKATNTRLLSCRKFGWQVVLVTEGTSPAHVNTIASEVRSVLRKVCPAVHVSDNNQRDWRIVCCEGLVAHVMSSACRKYYNLESLLRLSQPNSSPTNTF